MAAGETAVKRKMREKREREKRLGRAPMYCGREDNDVAEVNVGPGDD